MLLLLFTAGGAYIPPAPRPVSSTGGVRTARYVPPILREPDSVDTEDDALFVVRIL